MQTNVFKFEEKSEIDLAYLLYLPQDRKPGEHLPMIVFLHGAGERADAAEGKVSLVAVNGIPRYIEEGKFAPHAIVLCPQCPKEKVWNNLTAPLKALIDRVAEEQNADPDRISLTGLSMGGYGTWEMGAAYPGFFAALAPICGGGISWRAPVIGKTPVRAFHGMEDDVVPCRNSTEMCDALRRSGGNVSLTLFAYERHNSWDAAYRQTDLLSWLLSACRKG